jgi:phospholipid/cholesterol/gamma-HCH transport system substrate-binding protein
MDAKPRAINMVKGAIAITLLAALSTIGIKWAYGEFDGGYLLHASFDRAGQGLIPHSSEVKLRGYQVGEVESIELVDGRALVTMQIFDGERIPAGVEAVVRPKTLFGDKFVDLVPEGDTDTGPYFDEGATIPRDQTMGGFELEQVLEDLYPIVREIDPVELSTVIGTLADSARGLGPTISRSIGNAQEVFDVQAAHAADTRVFLADLAALSQEFGSRASDLVALADNLNTALPTINENPDDLNALLVQTGRLAGDMADLIRNNEAFFDASYTDGMRSLQVLYDDRSKVIPLVMGLRAYFQVFVDVIRVPVSDGSQMAAVKAIMVGELCELVSCEGTPQQPQHPAPAPPPLPAAPAPPELPALPEGPLTAAELVALGLPPELAGLDLSQLDLTGMIWPEITSGQQAIVDLVLGGVGR